VAFEIIFKPKVLSQVVSFIQNQIPFSFMEAVFLGIFGICKPVKGMSLLGNLLNDNYKH
jgi:hypothetical protein